MTYKLTVNPGTNQHNLHCSSFHHAKPDTEHPHIVLIFCVMIWDSLLIYPLATEEKYIPLNRLSGRTRHNVSANLKTQDEAAPQSPPYSPTLSAFCGNVGWMTAVDDHRPGYRGQLDHLPTLAEVLRDKAMPLKHEWQMACYLDAAFETPMEVIQFNGDSTNTTAACMRGS